jgi:hypothetical protein
MLADIGKLLLRKVNASPALEPKLSLTTPSLEVLKDPENHPVISEKALEKFPSSHPCWWDEQPSKGIIKIYVQPRNGNTIPLAVDLLYDTIRDVRSMVLKELGYLPPTYYLFRTTNGQEPLEENRKVSDCAIKDGEFFYIRKRTVISVKVPGYAAMTVHVDLAETVEDVKAVIEEEQGIATDSQQLSHLHIPLEDHMVLRDCGVAHGSELSMRMKGSRVDMRAEDEDGIQIMVRLLSGRTITVFTRESDLVSKVKKEIERKSGVKIEFQRLLFLGKQLETNKPLRCYSIRNGSTIILTGSLFSGGETKKEELT